MKKKKQPPKPIYKSFNKRFGFLKWAASHFPEDSENLTYIEPYVSSLGALFHKNKSNIELVNGTDQLVLNVYRFLRNKPNDFIKKLNRYKFCEDTFNKLKKSSINPGDPLNSSISEYLLRSMSKSESKDTFSSANFKSWKSSISNLSSVSLRIEETFISSESPLSIIKDFNFTDTLLFCDPPHLYETKKGKSVYLSEMSVNDHVSLSHLLNSFKGKVVLSGVVSPLYSRVYKGWNLFKSKYKDKSGKTEVIWKNF